MKIVYWNAETQSIITHAGKLVRSDKGYGPEWEYEYGVLYRLADGRYLGGVRNVWRKNHMTEIRYGDSIKKVMPKRWRGR